MAVTDTLDVIGTRALLRVVDGASIALRPYGCRLDPEHIRLIRLLASSARHTRRPYLKRLAYDMNITETSLRVMICRVRQGREPASWKFA